MSAAIAETLTLHRDWSFYLKSNKSDWKSGSFFKVYKITNVKEMWQILNNIHRKFTGSVNIFFMEGDLVPLWEQDVELWSDGGCWSTVIKGSSWVNCMHEICCFVMGESMFDDEVVKGICVVPVSEAHSIIKLWVTSQNEEIGSKLEQLFKKSGCCQPRFKSFR
tara:strand:- start:4327 stop:4818 length:492 start_codon:yes stop_codon:yes gene_type:complete